MQVTHHKDSDRPDDAFTTEHAKRKGLSNACSGKMRVTSAQHHFGPIGPEYDPERGVGLCVGDTWSSRLHCRQWGAHMPHVAGIAGQSGAGAQSIILSGAATSLAHTAPPVLLFRMPSCTSTGTTYISRAPDVSSVENDCFLVEEFPTSYTCMACAVFYDHDTCFCTLAL